MPQDKSHKLSELCDADLSMMLKIPFFENLLLDLFAKGEINGTTHTCLGQEYVPVAVQALLNEDDIIFSNHRCHGHFLARFKAFDALLAELMAKQGALCHGVGGSQHLFKKNCFLSTGVLGEHISVALGAALHFIQKKKKSLAVVYTGDGVWSRGSIYESLNMAALWNLPLFIIVENNEIAQSTARTHFMKGSIKNRAKAFDIPYLYLETKDLNVIRSQVQPYIQKIRQKAGPFILELKVCRLGPHSKGDDTRPPKELEKIARADWKILYQALYPQQVKRIEKEADAAINQIYQTIKSRPRSNWQAIEGSNESL